MASFPPAPSCAVAFNPAIASLTASRPEEVVSGLGGEAPAWAPCVGDERVGGHADVRTRVRGICDAVSRGKASTPDKAARSARRSDRTLVAEGGGHGVKTHRGGDPGHGLDAMADERIYCRIVPDSIVRERCVGNDRTVRRLTG